MTPAAMGADAEVPVWDEVQRLCRSVVTTFRSPDEPELEITQPSGENVSSDVSIKSCSEQCCVKPLILFRLRMRSSPVADEI
jgi:hypothetical protein